jgi:hypothetical protein
LIPIFHSGQFDRERAAASTALLNAIAAPRTLSPNLQVAMFQQSFGGIRV